MKQEILTALRESGGYLSGQELCERFGVSRTSVWKKIRQLQEEGYRIEAVPNRGYRLTGFPDTTSAQEVLSRMQTSWIARDVRYFEQIDTTNRFAKKLGEEGEKEGVLVIADEQTAGKGRSGRSWTTPPGSAIAMTLLLRPRLRPERISMVTLVMGLAVTEAVNRLFEAGAGIKWPNDVVIDGKKICGILTEMSAEMDAVNYIVIGVGINANARSFPEEISKTATSLALELGHDISRAELIAETMKCFESRYENFLQHGDLSGMSEAYNRLLLNRGREVRVLDAGGEYTGTALGVNDMGELLVKRSSGQTEKVYAGEVSVRGIYGYV